MSQFIATEANAKYRTAILVLYLHDFAPFYALRGGRTKVLGRTTAYQFMADLGYQWNGELQVWEYAPPF